MACVVMACVVTAYTIMAYIVMAYIGMTYIVSHGLHCGGIHGYGLHTYGLLSYGTCVHGLMQQISAPKCAGRCHNSMAASTRPSCRRCRYIVMAHIVMACMVTICPETRFRNYSSACSIHRWIRSQFRLHVGIADGVSVVRVWACRCSK